MADHIPSEVRVALCKKMGANLAILRMKAGLKQEDLAERLGVSRQTISVVENEHRVLEWLTFSALVMFFAKDKEIKAVMIALGIINEEVERALNINSVEGCGHG